MLSVPYARFDNTKSFCFSLFFFFFLIAAYCDAILCDWLMEGPKRKAFRSIWNRKEWEKGEGREGKRKIKRGKRGNPPPLSFPGNSNKNHVQQKEGV